jgi:hypothetical protein
MEEKIVPKLGGVWVSSIYYLSIYSPFGER